jgi:hypothetical protein
MKTVLVILAGGLAGVGMLFAIKRVPDLGKYF